MPLCFGCWNPGKFGRSLILTFHSCHWYETAYICRASENTAENSTYLDFLFCSRQYWIRLDFVFFFLPPWIENFQEYQYFFLFKHFKNFYCKLASRNDGHIMIKTPYFYVYSRQSFAAGTIHIYCEKQAHNRSSFTKELYFSKRLMYLKYCITKNIAARLITSEPGHIEPWPIIQHF